MSTQNASGTNTNPNAIPPAGRFELLVDKLYRGPEPAELPCQCLFSYEWDFGTNMGIAHLVAMDGTQLNIVLHPLGIEGHLDFMSDMKPTPYKIRGREVVIFRVILHLDPRNGNHSAAIMFQQDGSVIQTSAGFNTDSAHLKLEAKK